jgi:hypothetical protein
MMAASHNFLRRLRQLLTVVYHGRNPLRSIVPD